MREDSRVEPRRRTAQVKPTVRRAEVKPMAQVTEDKAWQRQTAAIPERLRMEVELGGEEEPDRGVER